MAAYLKQVLGPVLRYYLYGKAKNTLPELLINRLHPVHSGKELIRLGPKGDGGYLVPDDLAGIEACFSPGIGMISGFEDDCAKQGMKVFMADGSVNELPSSHRLFDFTKKHLGITTNSDFITLDDWVTQSLPDSQNDLLLQMDIEGAEYDVLANASDQLLSRFRIIAIEFHSLDRLWRKPFLKRVLPVFNKILQTHSCVHAHPNNGRAPLNLRGLKVPQTLELTFLRNDHINDHAAFCDTFPHPLDYDNVRRKPSVPLPKQWYRHK